MMKHLESLPNCLPVVLHIADTLCVVVGSGPMADAKVNILLRGGARVHYICPPPVDDIPLIDHPNLQVSHRHHIARDLQGVTLVFAQSDDHAMNKRVLDDCRFAGIPCSTCDHKWQTSDFHLPPSFSCNEKIISVSGSPEKLADIQHTRTLLESFLYSTQEPNKKLSTFTKGKGIILAVPGHDGIISHKHFLEQVEAIHSRIPEAILEPAIISGAIPDLTSAVNKLLSQQVTNFVILPLSFSSSESCATIAKQVEKALQAAGATSINFDILPPLGEHPLVEELIINLIASPETENKMKKK